MPYYLRLTDPVLVVRGTVSNEARDFLSNYSGGMRLNMVNSVAQQ